MDTGPSPNALAELDSNQLMATTCLDFLHTKLSFIQHVRNTTLDDVMVSLVMHCRGYGTPSQSTLKINNSVTQLALMIFVALEYSCSETYNKIWRVIKKCYESTLPSFYNTKKLPAEISGVESVVNDICINSYIVFVEPYSYLEE